MKTPSPLFHMRLALTHLRFALAGLLLFCLNSCSRESAHLPAPTIKTNTALLSVAEAQQWYTAQAGPVVAAASSARTSATGNISGPLPIDWVGAIDTVAGNQSAVLAQVREVGPGFTNGGYQSFRYLLITRPAPNLISGALVEILLKGTKKPSKETQIALLTAAYKRHRTSTGDLPNDFTGFVFFYSQKYLYQDGEGYVNGKPIAGHMRFSPETVTTSGVNKSKTARTLGCDSYLISSYDPPYVETICFTEPDLGYYDPGLYNGTYDPGYSGGIQNTPYTGTSSSSGSSGSTGVGGSTGDDGTLNTNDVFIDPPVNGKITDIQSYMKCFNASQSASLSVYVEQPKPGTRKAWTGIPGTARFSAGHTFISITQGNTTRVIGFYPASTMTAGDMGKTIPSALVDDSDHTYNIRINSALSPSQLQALLGYISSYGGSQYSLSNYNCTDFSVGAAAAAGLVLPDTVGSWLGGSGSDPGDLGEDIRSMSPPASGTIDTNSGQADSFNGTC